MDTLKRMTIFSHVVEARSFSAAARKLGIARSAVSRHIAELEKHVGVRLLNRTTRSVNLTEAGETYYQSCVRIMDEAEAAHRRISQLRDEPAGTLRIAGPGSFGRQLAILSGRFMQRHPALNVELVLEDQIVDMVEDGIDVSIRVGWLEDTNLVARHLCESPRLLCASPAYIERHGKPESPRQLREHECIIFSQLPTPCQWQLACGKQQETVQVRGRLKTNSALAIHALLLDGAGIAVLSNFLVGEDIRAGRLVRLLPEYECGSAGVYAVYQNRLYQQARVRLFIDYIRRHIVELI